MRVRVDAAACAGHGRCYVVAPDLLTYDAEGFVSIRGQALDVPPDQEDAAREAALACPEAALLIE